MKKINRFWQFHFIFWLIAGTALFASGTSQTTIDVALIRNLHLTILGLVTGPFFAQLFRRLLNKSPRLQLGFVLTISYVFSVFAMLVTNPITFEIKGVEMDTLSFSQWLSGSLKFALVLSLWNILFLFLVEKSISHKTQKPPSVHHLAVEKGQQTQMLAIEDILYIQAAGH